MILNMMKHLLPSSSEHVTIELREVVKDSDIFDRCDPFPIWDENHRGELEKKIIEHYYFRQIGFETVGRFIFNLNVRMREIMPSMIKLWETTQFKYNPIENYNMEEKGTDKSKRSGDSLSKFSETPGGALEGIDALKDGKYMTNASHGSDKSEGEDVHEFSRHGNIGVTTTQQMIQAERDIIIDIDLKIIEELKDLFLGVY